MSGSIKSTIVPSTTYKLKRASNIQKLDVSKNTLSVSKTDDLESVSKKQKIIKRRYTIPHDKADKTMTESELKCNTCDLFFKTKGTLSRHMKSNKHEAKVKSLKGTSSFNLSTNNLLKTAGFVWGTVVWNSFIRSFI